MSDGLGNKAINGTVWVFVERLALEAFRFITTIILARILGPSDFGLVALTSIFIVVSTAVIDSGFSKALLRKKESNVIEESTVFYFNIIISLLLVLSLIVFSNTIAEYYREPRLAKILIFLSFTLIISAFRQIQQVVLTKDFNFKIQFKANVLGSAISGVVGIILAFLNFGIWALVIQNLLDNLIKTLLFWFYSNWRPKLVFSKVAFKELYKYGVNLFVNDLLKTFTENIYGIIIGKFYSPYNLGLYDRGNKLAGLVITNFQFSIQKVTFPLFAKVQDNIEVLRGMVKKSLDLIMFLVLPAMFMLYITAEPLTLILLTEKWIEVVPYIQLFCIYWVFFPFSGVNNHLVLILGHSKVIMKQAIYIYGLQLLLLLITYKLGVYYIIVGQIVNMVLRQLILIYYSNKFIGFGFKEQGLLFIKHLAVTSIAILPWGLLKYLISQPYVLIVAQVIACVISYLFVCVIIKSENLSFLLKYLNRKQKNGKALV